jgi:hypothetical protein
MRRYHLLSVLSLVVALPIGGCSNPTGEGAGKSQAPGSAGSGTSISSYCFAVCGKSTDCDSSVDIGTCANKCENDNAAAGPKLRGDYLSRLESCVKGKDCATVLARTAQSTCADEVVASLSPSSVGTAFCDAYASAATKCGGNLDKATCLDAAKSYNDAALNEAKACTSRACSDIDSCVQAALGLPDTSASAANNSCSYAYDGSCDEPDLCAPGTDTYDCS